jgi:hypothetical protein
MENLIDDFIVPVNNQREKKAMDHVNDLFSYLYNDPQIPSIFEKSKNNLYDIFKQSKPEKMISFVGAGTAEPLGIPDWETLIKKLLDLAENDGFEGNLPDNHRDYPILAQKIYEHFCKKYNCADKYYEFIKQNMIPRKNSTTLTLVKLIHAFDIHLTTNFDNSLENAYRFLDYLANYYRCGIKSKECKPYCVPDLEWHDKSSAACIYYLHGNIDKHIYILNEDDYAKYYPSVSQSENSVDSLETFLKKRYQYNMIIFLGFSFSDHYVKEFFFKLAKKIDRENSINASFYAQSGQQYMQEKIRHYLMIDSDKLTKFGVNMQEIFQNYNICVVIYKAGEHIFLEKLFEHLSQHRKL